MNTPGSLSIVHQSSDIFRELMKYTDSSMSDGGRISGDRSDYFRDAIGTHVVKLSLSRNFRTIREERS